jgi:hypothetical protein
VVDHKVAGNPQKPRCEWKAPFLVPVNRLKGLQEDLGGDVFGENGVAG